jgi:NAD dependent epimerase/dehydratase family enzyme
MGRPAFFPVPSFVLKTLFGQLATILLDGRRAVPQHLQELGYNFKFPSADAAFQELT